MSTKLRTILVLILIFLIFCLGIFFSIFWGAYKLSPLNEQVSNQELIYLEKQFNLNDRAKVVPLLEDDKINTKIFSEQVIKLDLDIFRQNLGKIKFIIQKDIRKTLFDTGQITLKNEFNKKKQYSIGSFTIQTAANIFSFVDNFFAIYDPLNVDCIDDAFYLRIPYLKFEDSIDVLDIQCAFKGTSRLRVYDGRHENVAFIISRSIPIKNTRNEIVGVLSVISDAQIFEQKLGNAFNVILTPVIISILFAWLFIYYFQLALMGQATRNWVNAKNIAHNLKNKTNAIKFYTQKQVRTVDDAIKIINKIKKVNDNLNDLIFKTLDKARSEHSGKKNKEKYDKSFCSIKNLFVNIKELYISENIEFKIKDDFFVIGVEDEILQALCVVIDNAIFWHKSKEDIIVNVKKDRDQNYINIIISDRGPGIAKNDKQNIFKLNYSRAGSTGIGLYKAALIIKDLQGKIEFSNRPGGGTSFIFKLRIFE